jgi:hypothetical protein
MKTTSRHPRVPFIRRAKAMAAVAVAAVLATTASPALAATPPPPPPATPVRQLQTITLFQVTTEECVAGDFGVVPSAAGIVTTAVDGSGCRIQFTANSTYLGPVTVSDDDNRTVQLEVTNKNASIGATFIPKAAPGPCIKITYGANVDFGQITIGVPVNDGTKDTGVESCALTNMALQASVSPATSGGVTMRPVASPAEPGPNQFSFGTCWFNGLNQWCAQMTELPSTFPGDLPFAPGDTRRYSHVLKIGAGSSGVGQQFSTTVTLTATTA